MSTSASATPRCDDPPPDTAPARAAVGDARIAAQILALTAARGPERSICPSEVARAVAGALPWQPLMSRVRHVAAGLARAGHIDILRKGRPIDPDAVRGVIRLRLRPETPGPDDTAPSGTDPSGTGSPGTAPSGTDLDATDIPDAGR